MKVTVNGIVKEVPSKATLKDAISGEPYADGSLISIYLSTERIKEETNDLELVTTKGSMTLHLDDSNDARTWKKIVGKIEGIGARWVTRRIAAFGSFPTDLKVSREARMYRYCDCFFSLGGFDNSTTYMMIAMEGHKWPYGAGTGRIGRITSGRHILGMLREGDKIISIRPVVSEKRSENIIVTKDTGHKLEEGMSIETYVNVSLNRRSPMSCEHFLVTASKGYVDISDTCGSYAACSDNTDVVLNDEEKAVRGEGHVTVRTAGIGKGRIFFYKERRQMLQPHNDIGKITLGKSILAHAKAGDRVTVSADQRRVLSVGMTQSEGQRFLDSFGVRQVRTGDTSDDAVIVEQEPEWTIHATSGSEAETFGVPAEKVFPISLNRKGEPASVHYFEKVTGLSHKPIGTMKVHFAFKGMPMMTFEGDEERGKALYPGTEFKRCKKGDIGITNQARPNCGLMGIRLEDSKEFGPTGEEPYGTNITGTFKGDIKRLADGSKEGDIIYIREDHQ
ncbi:MAG: methanogenesis marker 3 protein [Methanomassiliicoccaceae archaeon]|jgi:putative methanogenesis marker protein 3|nr:methanogenesis marker 3 protein [Methanomassiliicoccaceae archaeon]